MAEIEIPKVDTNRSTLTRERSSLTQEAPRTDIPDKGEFSGAITVHKKTWLERAKAVIISEDAHDIGSYIVWDILIPTIRRTLRDIIVGSTDRVLLGSQPAPSTLQRNRGSSMVRFTNYSQPSLRAANDSVIRRVNTPSFQVDDIRFESRTDAESTLDWLLRCIDVDGKVSVYRYLNYLGREVDYTAQNWGWVTLNSARVQQTFDGQYSILLPAPVAIYRG